MIKITIEGPAGVGKTKIAKNIGDYLDAMGMSYMFREESTEAAIAKHKPDVLIETKQVSA